MGKLWANTGHAYFYVYSFDKQPPKPKKLGWVKVDKGWKYYKADGFPMQGEWVEHKEKWYYLKEDGSMAVNEVLKLNGVFYMLNAKGVLDTEIKNYRK